MTAPDIPRVVETARRAATAAHHAFVGTEHLLAAVLTEQDGAAARLLTDAGVSLDGLAEELLSGLPPAATDAAGPPSLSRFAERAVAEAGKPGGSLVAVLLRAPRGKVASVLAKRGGDLNALRKAIQPEREPRPDKEKRRKPDKAPGIQAREREKQRERPPKPAPDEPERLERPNRRLPPHLDKQRPRGKEAKGGFPWSMLLLLAVPASLLLRWQHAGDLPVFVTACLGLLPLAGLMGQATEQIAERTGPTMGGLMNATFGNAAELIIAIVALRAGLIDLVKASITGSILGNLLLILGLSLVAGGTRAPILKFNRTSAGMGAAMLALAVAGLGFPALFHLVHPGTTDARLAITELDLSQAVSVILAITYGLSLLFSLHTHKTIFGFDPGATAYGASWGLGKSIGVLGMATAGVVVLSEVLVHSIEGVTTQIGLSETFVGLIIVPIIGNAAEHATAVVMARNGKTDLALQIALGSSTQVALLVAPLLVLAGVLIGAPLNLVFTPLEVAALAISTIVVSIITLDGESHWFEGAQLLALYGIVAAAAFFV